MQVARWWQQQLKGIECFLCLRCCLIAEGFYGFCNVRKNESMTLLILAYNHPIGVNLEPVEKNRWIIFILVRRYCQPELLAAV